MSQKTDKYVVQTLQEPANMSTPEFKAMYEKFAKRILWMDTNVVEGAFQMNTAWYFDVPEADPVFPRRVLHLAGRPLAPLRRHAQPHPHIQQSHKLLHGTHLGYALLLFRRKQSGIHAPGLCGKGYIQRAAGGIIHLLHQSQG